MDYEKKYKEALERAKEIIECSKSHTKEVRMVLSFFPELAESEDEKIKKEIIATIHLYYGEPLEDKAKEMLAWLEKQGEHAKFLDSIQVGDKVTRNQDGVLVNLSQLKRVAKKDEKQGKQKPAEWSEKDESNLDSAISYIRREPYSESDVEPKLIGSNLSKTEYSRNQSKGGARMKNR